MSGNQYLLFSLFIGCSDYELKEQAEAESGVYPEIVVTPPSLSFTEVEVGSSHSEFLTITNVGSAELMVTDLEVLGSLRFSFTELSEHRLPAGTSQDLLVTYSPTEADSEDVGSLLVSSNDLENPMVEVPLQGDVQAVSMPILQINPISLDLGNLPVGDTTSGTFSLESVGEAPVTLNSLSLTGTVFTAHPTESWPLTLEPGASTLVDVDFIPTQEASFTETLTVHCEEPASDPSATIVASSQATDPVAVCSVDPTQIQPNSSAAATWIGSGSYDSTGVAIVDYDWTLVSKPAGSNVIMPPGSADRSGFQPDLAGEYIGRLVVTNEYGVESEPCETILEGVPGQGFWVQMSWASPGDDMDLHLTLNNGTYNSSDDCYYSNCTSGGLDWGVAGNTSDNPSLDMDDIFGTGPENITIQSPASGVYTVVVHDHTSQHFPGANNVTVDIFIGGSLVWTDTRAISGEDVFTPFAEIMLPAGLINSL